MTGKKQAVFVRIIGLDAHSGIDKMLIGKQIQGMLQQHFEKEVVVMLYDKEIEFVNEGTIRELIEALENTLK